MSCKLTIGPGALLLAACLHGAAAGEMPVPAKDTLTFPNETHLANLRQLSFGGQNAEAYFSRDGSELVFQSTRGDLECDAIFRMNSDGTGVRQLSSGRGVTSQRRAAIRRTRPSPRRCFLENTFLFSEVDISA